MCDTNRRRCKGLKHSQQGCFRAPEFMGRHAVTIAQVDRALTLPCRASPRVFTFDMVEIVLSKGEIGRAHV